MRIEHHFVDFIPSKLEPGIMYIAMDFGTIVHLCACGCGNETVTPLSHTDWSMTFNGETVSLSPSVGNWSFPCQSHYFITKGEVCWAPRWSAEKIAEGRQYDRALKDSIVGKGVTLETARQADSGQQLGGGWVRRLIRRLIH